MLSLKHLSLKKWRLEQMELYTFLLWQYEERQLQGKTPEHVQHCSLFPILPTVQWPLRLISSISLYLWSLPNFLNNSADFRCIDKFILNLIKLESVCAEPKRFIFNPSTQINRFSARNKTNLSFKHFKLQTTDKYYFIDYLTFSLTGNTIHQRAGILNC